MHLLRYISLVAASVRLVLSQQIIPTAGSSIFPACALQCPTLLDAQSTCTPPRAISATQLVYDDCFCQMPTLDDLYTTGETVCTAQCTATSDRQLLSTWFATFCQQVRAGNLPGASTTAQTTLSTSTISSATTKQTSTSTSNGAIVTPTSYATGGKWVSTHWQWIVMLLFLFFGLLGLGFGARWFKRRHDQKAERKRAALSDFPITEDPKIDGESPASPDLHPNTAINKGHQYTSTGILPSINEGSDSSSISKEKGQRASRVDVAEIQPVPPPVHTKDSKSRPFQKAMRLEKLWNKTTE